MFRGLLPRFRPLLTRLMSSDSLRGEHLSHRSLISVAGKDASSFIQGLITNDTKHLEEGARCIYTMFLNTQGRVMYDALIYRKEPDLFLIEVEEAGAEKLRKHLMMYRVRRKIDIEHVADTSVWVVYRADSTLERAAQAANGEVLCGPEPAKAELGIKMAREPTFAAHDPRTSALGHRILLPSKEKLSSYVDTTPGNYTELRYRLGISEGAQDLPSGACFPLESNCDYLHGVNFHKGCYVGQELTARTHHVGVIRKRIMPLVLEEGRKLDPNSPVANEKGKLVGRTRGFQGKYGIGLMRITESLGAPNLKVGGVDVKVHKPAWWPAEAPKENQIKA